jgi:activating signal cointegrator 1
MKALTLWQPWASLVARGHKSVETRCWSTKYRGELAIHSAANLPVKWLGQSRHQPEFRDALADIFNARRDRDERCGYHVDDAIKGLPRGYVLCIVRLVDIQETGGMDCCELPETERLFGNYELGRYAWFLEMVKKFDEPIPAKGNRMLWNWLDSDHG